MRTLPQAFAPYSWAPSTEELARRAELDPSQIIRFDGNVPPWPRPSARPGTIAGRLAEINAYPHGGYPELLRAIADYAGVEPEQIVLGAGADDLILLCARAFAGPGDTVAIAESPTYPLYAVAAGLAGAEVGDADPAVTFTCRPNNPTGELGDLPDGPAAGRRRGVLGVRRRDGRAPARRRGRRHPDVLEGVRPRRRAHRLRARGRARPLPS